MENRILGIDFSDAGTILSFYGEDKSWNFPTFICRIKGRKEWLLGEEAYEKVLQGDGILTDKLLSLVQKGGSATLYSIKYTADQLLTEFFKALLEKISAGNYPTDVVVSIPQVERKVMASIRTAWISLGYPLNRIHVISRSESFIYYVMSQNQELRNNNVALFSLEDNDLTYYELKPQRKAKSLQVIAEKEKMDESFNLDIIRQDAGAKLADKILLSCAERVLKNKVFSAVLLTGNGFRTYEWAENFMKFICNRRKVFIDDLVFSNGATYRGVDFASDKPVFNFTPICDGRLECSIFVDIMKDGRIVSYPLVSAGEAWFDADRSLSMIADQQDTLELNIIPMDGRKRKNIRLSLDFLPKRPPKTTRFSLNLSFLDDATLHIDVHDEGFGELFPATDRHSEQEVRLWD